MSVNYHVFSSIHASLLLGNPPIWSCASRTAGFPTMPSCSNFSDYSMPPAKMNAVESPLSSSSACSTPLRRITKKKHCKTKALDRAPARSNSMMSTSIRSASDESEYAGSAPASLCLIPHSLDNTPFGFVGSQAVGSQAVGSQVPVGSGAATMSGTLTASSSKGIKSYDWTITSYRDMSKPPRFIMEKMWFLVFQREVCPRSGNHHWQGYVQFRRMVNLKSAQFLVNCPDQHMEAVQSTPQANYDYCTKIDTRLAGTEPYTEGFMQPRIEGVHGDRAMYAHLRAKGVSDAELYKMPELANVMSSKTLSVDPLKDSQVRKRLCYAVLGATTIGKSWIVRRVCEHVCYHFGWTTYQKNQSMWWQHYNMEEIVIFNEYDARFSYQSFKLLIDGDRYILDIKGTSTVAPIRLVLLCSNKPLETWYPNLPDNERAAVFSRIKKTWKMETREQQGQIGIEMLTHIIYDIREVEKAAIQIEFPVDAMLTKVVHDYIAANPGDKILAPKLKREDLVTSKLRAIAEHEAQTGEKIPYLMLKDVQQNREIDDVMEIAPRTRQPQSTVNDDYIPGPGASPFTIQLAIKANRVYEGMRRRSLLGDLQNIAETSTPPCSSTPVGFYSPEIADSSPPSPSTPVEFLTPHTSESPGPLPPPVTPPVRRPKVACRQDPPPTDTPCYSRSPPSPEQSGKKINTRLTPPFLNKARTEENVVLWINRYSFCKDAKEVICKRKYLQLLNKQELKLFLDINSSAIDDGTCTLDEVCVHGQQKVRLDIDGSVNDFEGVSSDFTQGTHVAMIVAVCEALCAAISKVSQWKVTHDELAIYTTCRGEKLSVHVVHQSGTFPRFLVQRVAEECKLLCPSYCRKYLDMGIYTEKHCFRIWSSCKFRKSGKEWVDKASVKRKVNLEELFGNNKLVAYTYDRAGDDYVDQFIASLISCRQFPRLVYDEVIYQRPSSQNLRTKARISPPSHLAPVLGATIFAISKEQFHSTYCRTNILEVLADAATSVCGGKFAAREAEPHIHWKYIQYPMKRLGPGECKQCHRVHDNEGCTCSLINCKSKVATLYTLSVSCRRFVPKQKGRQYMKFCDIMIVDKTWTKV